MVIIREEFYFLLDMIICESLLLEYKKKNVLVINIDKMFYSLLIIRFLILLLSNMIWC